MNEYENLVATLKSAGQSLRTLHHNLVGPEWFPTHALLGEYYAKIDDIEDAMVEIGMSQGITETGMAEAIQTVKPLTVKDRSAKESLKAAKDILQSVIDAMATVREMVEDEWICSKIDSFNEWLVLEVDYKLERAIR